MQSSDAILLCPVASKGKSCAVAMYVNACQPYAPYVGWTRLPRCACSASTLASGSMSELESGIDAVVRRHVPDARLLSCAGGEIAFRLPKSDAAKCVLSCSQIKN